MQIQNIIELKKSLIRKILTFSCEITLKIRFNKQSIVVTLKIHPFRSFLGFLLIEYQGE